MVVILGYLYIHESGCNFRVFIPAVASGKRSHTIVKAAAKRNSTTCTVQSTHVKGAHKMSGDEWRCGYHGPVAGTEKVEVVEKITENGLF